MPAHASPPDARPAESARLRQGMLYMIVGTSIVPIMDAIAKHLGDSLSPLLITWARFVFQFLFMGGALLASQGVAALLPRRPGIHAVRGVLLATATTLFFLGLRYLPLAEAIAIFFVQPLLLSLISVLFLGERIGWHRRIAVLLGFGGALLIIRPGSGTFGFAALLPLAAALFFSSYLAVTRSVANVDHPLSMQFASGLAATLVLSLGLLVASRFPASLFAPSAPTPTEWLWLALIGLIAAVGHLLVVMGMNRAPASLLAPFGYVEIVAATLLGWWFFGDWPDAITWLGILVIVGSGIHVFERERR